MSEVAKERKCVPKRRQVADSHMRDMDVIAIDWRELGKRSG